MGVKPNLILWPRTRQSAIGKPGPSARGARDGRGRGRRHRTQFGPEGVLTKRARHAETLADDEDCCALCAKERHSLAAEDDFVGVLDKGGETVYLCAICSSV